MFGRMDGPREISTEGLAFACKFARVVNCEEFFSGCREFSDSRRQDKEWLLEYLRFAACQEGQQASSTLLMTPMFGIPAENLTICTGLSACQRALVSFWLVD